MDVRGRAAWVGVVALALALTGCSTTAAGVGRPQLAPTAALTLSAAADPCAPIGSTTRTALGITSTDPDTPIGETSFCSFRISTGRGFQLIMEGDNAVDDFIGVYADDAVATKTTIGGRPAVIAVETDGYAECTVAIQVGPQATVGVIGHDFDADPEGPDSPVCAATRTAATAAVSGVLTGR